MYGRGVLVRKYQVDQPIKVNKKVFPTIILNFYYILLAIDIGLNLFTINSLLDSYRAYCQSYGIL